MKKMPTIFLRDPDNRARVLPDDWHPEATWVRDGEGIATRKFDGVCVMLDAHGNWWARREVKPGKAEPTGWVEVDVDDVTGKRMGWEPVEQSSHARFHAEALVDAAHSWREGTYELCGPKVNGNPERFTGHTLVPHGMFRMPNVPRTYEGLREFLAPCEWEGLVWHHPDGRMAKIKRKDFPA